MHAALDRQHPTPTPSMYRWGIQVASGLLLGLALACSGGGGGTPTPPAAPTATSLTATPAILTTGDTTPIRLTPVFANGTGAVDPGVGAVTSGTAYPIAPVVTTTYTLTVTNSAGTTATKSAVVTFVAAPTTPVISPLTDVTANQAGYTATVPVQTGCTYAWGITSGTITAGVATNTITFTAGASGAVHLTCTVTNEAGLASTPGTADRAIVPTVVHTLAVTVTKVAATGGGLTAADVSVTGQSNLTASHTFDCTSWADGDYTITAINATDTGSVIHYPYLRTQIVHVTSGVPNTNTVTVLYPAPTLTVDIPDVTATPGVTVPMEFVLVPPGSFTMGAEADTDDSKYLDATLQHTVTILHAFYVAKYECTQAQWLAVADFNPSYFSITGGGALVDDLQRPVERVSWNRIRVEMVPEAPVGKSFLGALNDAVPTKGFRLPSEAEYEYVVRAGTTDNFFFGPAYTSNAGLDAYAWYNQDAVGTHPVGLKLPNPWGLYDIIGNVYEWCEDDAHGTVHNSAPGWTTDNTGYAGAPFDGGAWVDGSRAATRILRGGAWSGDDNTSPRSAFRFSRVPDETPLDMQTRGFRLVMPVPVD